MLGERCSALLQRAGSSGDNLTLLAARLAAAEKERDAARWGGLLQSVPMRLLTVCLCLSCVCVWVRALVEIERQRATDLVHVAEAAR